MATRALDRIRESIRKRQYVMALHAEDEMDADGLTIFDVESVILTGRSSSGSVTLKPRSGSTLFVDRRWVVRETAVVVSKFGPTGKLVILTVYVD